MQPHGQGDGPGDERRRPDGTGARWGWPAAALFILVCSLLGWLGIAALVQRLQR